MLRQSRIFYLQGTGDAGATANGNGLPADLEGFTGDTMLLEIAETAGGTATVTLAGSLDGTNWITGVGYELVDATASPARAVAALSVSANTRHAYAVLDKFPQVRAVLSSSAGGSSVTVRLYAA